MNFLTNLIITLLIILRVDLASPMPLNTAEADNGRAQLSSNNDAEANVTEMSIYQTYALPDSYESSLHYYAQFSAIAYCTRKWDGLSQGPINELCGDGYSVCRNLRQDVEVVDISNGLVNGIIFLDRTEERIIWAFKGTTSNNEWLLNSFTNVVPFDSLDNPDDNHCRGCLVHLGFHQGSLQAWQIQFPKLANLIRENPNYQVAVTGHSLGGAIATLVGTQLKAMGYDDIRVVTFGQPKVGNRATAQYMDTLWGEMDLRTEATEIPKGLLRVINKDDVVHLVPLTSMGFKHACAEVAFKRGQIPSRIHDAQVRMNVPMAKSVKEETKVPNIIFSFASTKRAHKNFFVVQEDCLIEN